MWGRGGGQLLEILPVIDIIMPMELCANSWNTLHDQHPFCHKVQLNTVRISYPWVNEAGKAKEPLHSENAAVHRLPRSSLLHNLQSRRFAGSSVEQFLAGRLPTLHPHHHHQHREGLTRGHEGEKLQSSPSLVEFDCRHTST